MAHPNRSAKGNKGESANWYKSKSPVKKLHQKEKEYEAEMKKKKPVKGTSVKAKTTTKKKDQSRLKKGK